VVGSNGDYSVVVGRPRGRFGLVAILAGDWE